MPLDVRDNVPSRETSDQLILCYLRTFESTYRILHIPSFQTEYHAYWLNPPAASDVFVIKLLLVMAIGTCFYQEPPNPNPLNLRVAAVQWIYTAQSWLSSPFEKSRINLANLQIHCLLLLARQTNAVDGDLIWISAGSLLRIAMHIGLHRDPSHVPKVSVFYAEQRRRLWATVLEMLIQSSMDSGCPPLISLEDFDCGPPSNIDDLQINESTKTPLVPKPEGVFTETSIQITLARSLPVRLAIAKLLNDLRSGASYDETLRLAADLTAACRHNALSIQSWLSHSIHPNTEVQPTSFQTKLLELLTHRFILALHMPFAIKARTNPIYYFSRKICLETSLFLLSSARPPPQAHITNSVQPLPADDYTSIKLCGGGLFRGVPLRAVTALALEVISQLSTPSSAFLSTSESIERQEARRAIEEYVELTALRIEAGERSVKGHVFASCILAQIDALQAGKSVDSEVSAAVTRSIDRCYDILKQRAAMDAEGEDAGTGWSGDGSEHQTGDRNDENTLLDGFGWDGVVSFDLFHCPFSKCLCCMRALAI